MKNLDYVNKVISVEKGIPEKTVKAINDYYWKTIRYKIVNLESTSVMVHGITTFMVSRYNIRKEISLTILKIRRIRGSETLTEKKKNFILIEYYSFLRKLLIQRNELAILYNTLYYDDRGISKNDGKGNKKSNEDN